MLLLSPFILPWGRLLLLFVDSLSPGGTGSGEVRGVDSGVWLVLRSGGGVTGVVSLTDVVVDVSASGMETGGLDGVVLGKYTGGAGL